MLITVNKITLLPIIIVTKNIQLPTGCESDSSASNDSVGDGITDDVMILILMSSGILSTNKDGVGPTVHIKQ